MNSDRKKYLLIGLAAILLTAGYFILKDNLTEWRYNLDKTQKNAYGTFLTYQLLKDHYKTKGFTEINRSVRESFRKLNKNRKYNYLFINQVPYYDSVTVDTICRFAEAGNTVFISCEGLYGKFLDSVLYKTYHLQLNTGYSELFYTFKDSTIETKLYSTFNFTHPDLKDKNGYLYYMKNKADTITNYYYKFEAVPDSEQTAPIPEINTISFAGYENSYDTGYNFALLKHGKGQFIILLSALPLTNYFMRTEKGLEYAEKVFAHLPEQATLWDNISQEYNFTESQFDHGDSSYGDSPLYFILKNRQLRRAWYLSILGVLIYAVFHAKRRQNIIPVMTSKQNTSLKYVETIGQLYYHEEEHIEIANEMRLQFMNYIRQKYNLKITDPDDALLKQLSLKSAIEEEKIKSLFEEFRDILNVKSIHQHKLHNLNQQLEYFYNHCK